MIDSLFRKLGVQCLTVLIGLAVCGCTDSQIVNPTTSLTSEHQAAAEERPTDAPPQDRSAPDSPQDDESEVRAAWAEFKEASLSGKGEIAANRVTTSTHGYYEEIRRLALTATREELAALVFAKRYTVLGMRLRMPADQLRNMSGRELFIHSVDQGWIGKNSATDEDIGGVTVTGDHARAVATKAGQPTGQYYHFLKEDGMWRLDMFQMMKFVNVALDQMLRNSGLTETEFTTRFLEATTGKVVSEALWIPPDASRTVEPHGTR